MSNTASLHEHRCSAGLNTLFKSFLIAGFSVRPPLRFCAPMVVYISAMSASPSLLVNVHRYQAPLLP